MGTLDDLTATFGADALTSTTGTRSTRTNWHELCVCGHLDRYHAPSIGGSYELVAPRSVHPRGSDEPFTKSQAFDGCVGALSSRGFEAITTTVDQETRAVTEMINPTCPCTVFRPVAKVDRPNRYFNQRVPTELTPLRHPMMVGIRAFSTHLSRRKPATADPTWATAEFERRFIWFAEKRRCSISRCRTADETVWPCFVTDGEALSELRCGSHRPA